MSQALQVTAEDSLPVVGLGLHSRLQIVFYVSPALYYSLSLICQPTSEDIKHHLEEALLCRLERAQELCESRSGRPALPRP